MLIEPALIDEMAAALGVHAPELRFATLTRAGVVVALMALGAGVPETLTRGFTVRCGCGGVVGRVRSRGSLGGFPMRDGGFSP